MGFRAGLAITVAAVVLSASAEASPISGSFQLTAAATPVNAGVTADMASGLNFTGNTVTSFSAMGSGTVISGLAGCAASCGSISNITSFASGATVAPLFSLTNGLSFDLTGYAAPTRTAASGMNLASIAISGTGTYHLTGYDDTFGTFKITTTGNTSYLTVAFGSATGSSGSVPPIASTTGSTPVAASPSAPTLVPEPGSMALVVASLGALGLLGRRRTVF